MCDPVVVLFHFEILLSLSLALTYYDEANDLNIGTTFISNFQSILIGT